VKKYTTWAEVENQSGQIQRAEDYLSQGRGSLRIIADRLEKKGFEGIILESGGNSEFNRRLTK